MVGILIAFVLPHANYSHKSVRSSNLRVRLRPIGFHAQGVFRQRISFRAVIGHFGDFPKSPRSAFSTGNQLKVANMSWGGWTVCKRDDGAPVTVCCEELGRVHGT